DMRRMHSPGTQATAHLQFLPRTSSLMLIGSASLEGRRSENGRAAAARHEQHAVRHQKLVGRHGWLELDQLTAVPKVRGLHREWIAPVETDFEASPFKFPGDGLLPLFQRNHAAPRFFDASSARS